MSKILVVDDEVINRKLIRTMLSDGGHEFLEAIEGETGLFVARISRPDLVILDIVMHPGNGIDFIKKLRQEPILGRIPILVLTGHLDTKIMMNSREAGCDAFLLKPVRQLELEREVERLLRRKG